MVTVGWHPDPADADRERWWDGVDWTSHTRLAAEPAGMRRSIGREPLHHAPDDHTRLLGWITGSPVWAGSVLVILSILGAWLPALLLVPVIAALCLLDRRALGRRGFARLPSRWWVALGPIGYLVGRRRALGQTDAAPLWIVIGAGLLMAVPVFIFTAVRLGMLSAIASQ